MKILLYEETFEDTLHLKKEAPNTPFAGYHGCLRSHHLDYEPGNNADEFITTFNAHYEHVIGSLIRCLPKVLALIKENKYSKLK